MATKGYVPYKGHGPSNVCLNPNQPKPTLTYNSKDVIECSGSVRTSQDKFNRQLRTREGNQYGELNRDIVRDPVKVQRPKSKNPSVFKGRTWGTCGDNVTVVRKSKKSLTR
jgi:hypothetical protein